jgi:predicted site-specific integrase-resolvase
MGAIEATAVPVPADPDGAVTADELRRLLKINRATFYRWQKAGKFRRLEIQLGGGVRRRYARRLVEALLAGERVIRQTA